MRDLSSTILLKHKEMGNDPGLSVKTRIDRDSKWAQYSIEAKDYVIID